MKVIKNLGSKNLIESLKKDQVAVIPTDTIYGIVGLASSNKAIEKIYQIKGRDPLKLFIVLISSLNDLEILGIKLDEDSRKIVEKYWPGKVSIIFKKGEGTMAVRLPDFPELIKLIKNTGPLVAPSANPEGLTPAKNIKEALNYFGDKVDYYVDWGILTSPPSTLVKLMEGKVVVLRNGAVTIDESDKAS